MKTKIERLSRVRNAIYGYPWMITPEWLDAICEIFEAHAAGNKIVYENDDPREKVQYEVIDGTAIIELMGPIFPRANLMTRLSGATSAEQFRINLRTALADPEVVQLIILIDSPGGSVIGAFEAATALYHARENGGKQIVALAEGVMASAAYLIGCQANLVFATEGSIVGSIGVVSRIDSDERAKKNEGIDSEIFKTGKLKAIGNGPITDEQRDAMQSMVEDYFDRFKTAVARVREVDIEAVSTGEVWLGKKAQTVGLIDGITTLEYLLHG